MSIKEKGKKREKWKIKNKLCNYSATDGYGLTRINTEVRRQMRKGKTEKGRNGEGEETRSTIPEFAFNLEPN
ncbi:MAG: hypothetical protein AB1414_13820 [bacterium]